MNKEISRLEYWIFDTKVKDMITADKAFIMKSERGIEPDFSKIENPYRYHQLVEAKKWEGNHIAMYEEGILEGSISYWVLLGGEDYREIPPLAVVNWMSKQLFKGIDKELILSVYKNILNYWTWWRRLWFWFFHA